MPWPPGATVSYAYSLGKGSNPPRIGDACGPASGWSQAQLLSAADGHYPTVAFDTAADQALGATTRYLYRMTSLGDAAWAGLGSGTAPALRCVHAMDVDACEWTDTFEVPFPAASHMSRS